MAKPKLKSFEPPLACKIEGCSGPAHEMGWCSKHYTRWYRHGDPLGGRVTMNGDPQRFLEDVVLPHNGTECLLWPFTKAKTGYGQIRIDGVLRSVHRVVCEASNGPAPELEAAHACGVRLCCNPHHLSWKTPKENAADKILHGTHQFGEQNHLAKLTYGDVENIIRLVGEGVTQTSLAKQYGVAPSTLNMAVKGRTWVRVD